MHKITGLILLMLLLKLTSSAQVQNDNPLAPGGFVTVDSITKGAYTLIFINKDSAFSEITKKRMADAFFDVYPREAARFNPATLSRVTFMIDPDYKGVAAAGRGVVRYNPKWLHDHPEDIDVVTHEVMHIVQSYPRGAGPGWLTEGIADYVRYKFGINNEAGKWSMPAYDTAHNYTRSYRITARFLAWLEKNVRPSIVNDLDSNMRSKTYTPELWKQLTNKSLDELWQQYASNPVL